MANLLDQTMSLPDGRTLGWNEYGDLAGKPMFYFHGLPSSRQEPAMSAASAATLKIRLISPDRPGMGLSSFQPKRTLLSWPIDILALADHLGLKTFHIVGASGGAPYVISCAKVIPRTRLLGAGIVCGLYPMAFGAKGTMARAPDPAPFYKMAMAALQAWPAQDRAYLDDEKCKTCVLGAFREAFRSSSDGPAWDFALSGSDWSFKLESVDYPGLVMFHGAQDVNTPLHMAQIAASKLTGSELVVFPDAGHLSCALEHIAELMERVLGPRDGEAITGQDFQA